MNVEFEVRAIISAGFSNKEKVELIQKIANFRDDDILFALRKKYEDERNLSGQIYAEMAKLSWRKER